MVFTTSPNVNSFWKAAQMGVEHTGTKDGKPTMEQNQTTLHGRAENKCRKLYMGNVQFSDTTDGPVKRIEWWLSR
jgi:hypothetical protein